MNGSTNTHLEYDIQSEEDALGLVERIDQRMPNLGASESLTVYKQFIDELGRAVAEDDIEENAADSTIRTLAESNGPYKFTRLEDMYQDAVNEHSDDPERLPLNDWLEEYVEDVSIQRSTDSDVESVVSWRFETGDTLETEKEHFDWSEFVERLNQTNHKFVFSPPDDPYSDKTNWKMDFMMPFLSKRAEATTVVGSRTVALDELKNTIRTRKAFDDVQEAYSGSGIYVEEEEFEWVYVLSRFVSNIADEHNETPRSLQAELDAKGIVNGKVSRVLQIDDSRTARFWRLPRDFAEPQIPDSLFNGGDEEDDIPTTRGDNE